MSHLLHRPASALTAVAAAMLLAFGPAPAAAADLDEVALLLRPESSVRFGLGYANEDNLRFGQYNGLHEKGAFGVLDIDYASRDNSTGTWLRLFGRNLGLDNRELRVERERQGDHGYFFDYSRITRHEPLTVQTGLTGVGSAGLVINGGAVRDLTLSTQRDRFTLGFDQALPGRLALQVRLRHEEKEGSRLFGRGTSQFLAEPIDSRTEQLEVSLGYAGEQLQVTGGYYGTAYTNRHAVLDVSTGTDISLAPDNASHQLFVAGGYSFSPSTRATFKLAHARGLQHERFYAAPDFPGNTQTSLNGRVDTTTAQLGLTARPMAGLSLVANLRYEDRDDKTPRYQFIPASIGRDGFNTPFSRTTTAAKLEASYRLPMGFQLNGGVDHDARKRTTLAIRQASWREKNDETSYRLEVRRSLSETLNGAVSYVRSDRGGSDYLPANNNVAVDYIDPVHFADRQRDRFRLTLDWAPIEALSLQLQLDDARDDYDGRPLGPQHGKARFWSVDGTYSLSDAWQAAAWVSGDDNRIEQATLSGANGTLVAAQTWQARLRTQGDAAGLGLRGKASARLEVGGDLQYSRDRNQFPLVASVPAAALLPDITTKHATLKLFGQYAVQQNLSVRVDLGHDRFSSDDWTWSQWTYTEGSTVTPASQGRTTWLGVSLVYRLW